MDLTKVMNMVLKVRKRYHSIYLYTDGAKETANMLIMMLAYSQASNDTTLLQRYVCHLIHCIIKLYGYSDHTILSIPC